MSSYEDNSVDAALGDAIREIDEASHTVGRRLTQALGEVATEQGGEQFAGYLMGLSLPESAWPAPAAMKLLENSYPGSEERVMERLAEIKEEERAHQQVEWRKERLRTFGKALLAGVGLLGGGTARVGEGMGRAAYRQSSPRRNSR